MRKEVAFAILLGFGIGLLIAFAIVTSRKALKNQSGSDETAPTLTADEPLSPTPAESKKLIVLTPINNSIVGEEEVTVSGSSTPEATIVITTEKDDKILTVDEAGKFSQSISLIGGANLIRVVSLGDGNDRTEVELQVVYTTAEF